MGVVRSHLGGQNCLVIGWPTRGVVRWRALTGCFSPGNLRRIEPRPSNTEALFHNTGKQSHLMSEG